MWYFWSSFNSKSQSHRVYKTGAFLECMETLEGQENFLLQILPKICLCACSCKTIPITLYIPHIKNGDHFMSHQESRLSKCSPTNIAFTRHAYSMASFMSIYLYEWMKLEKWSSFHTNHNHKLCVQSGYANICANYQTT